MASCGWPAARFVVVGGVHGVGGVANECFVLLLHAAAAASRTGGGVRARAWQAAAGQQQGSWSLVASLTIDLYCLCMLQRRRGWWRRPSSSMASCGWPAARFVVVGGVHGVGGVANECFVLLLHATAASRLVAASDLEHGKLRLVSSKVRGCLVACMALALMNALYCFCMLQRRRRDWWRRPSSSMASCGWPAARFVVVGGVHGVGGVANECFVLLLHATAASRLVAASDLEHGKLRLASSKVRGRWWRAWRWWRR
ncbi:hypothetical protein PF003_g20425 [Phytophthora fragariae]|nr:hypothetical protein PF003_g20425 [Phytophthora fragariae]